MIDISKYDRISLDSETTGLQIYGPDRAYGIAISTPDGGDIYVDIRTDTLVIPEVYEHNVIYREIKSPGVTDKLRKQLLVFNGLIIFHNESFDHRALHKENITWPNARTYDTCIAACLINEHEHAFSLDLLSKKYTRFRKQGKELWEKLAEMFGGKATKSAQLKNMLKAPPHIIGEYATADTRATMALYEYQIKEIDKQGLRDILKFEDELTPIIIQREMEGIPVDTTAAEKAVGDLSIMIKQKQKELDDIVGWHCNPQPSSDTKKIFQPEWRDGRWWAIDGTPLEMTGAGQPSIGADALREMTHPAAALILELRSLIKTRDTFLVGHVLESSYNGRVYPNINQNKGEEGGTGTGRLSYTNPALQQIPDRNKRVAQIVKSVFIPEKGHMWVDADKASFEVRIFAHLVGTPDIVEAYLQDPETDFHQYVAGLTNLPRNATYNGEPNAKQLNLSMIFNQGDGTTAEKLNMPWTWESFTDKQGKMVTYRKPGPEAKRIIEMYHSKLPGVKRLAMGCKMKAEQRGYIFTRRGRHLRFPHKGMSYKASGILIQSTAADENKANWIIIDKALKDIGNGSKMLLNTHDSYSLSIPKGEEERTAKLVKSRIEEDRGLRVPLILEVQHPGNTWWESKNSKRWM